jgi:hypothetical protein
MIHWLDAQLQRTTSVSAQSSGTTAELSRDDIAENQCTAASNGCLPLLQHWLNSCSTPCSDVFLAAAQSGSVDTIAWLLQQYNTHCSAILLTRMLEYCGVAGQLPAVQWLVQYGAVWPKTGVLFIEDDAVTVSGCWSIQTMQYALQHGCAAGEQWSTYMH